MRPPPKDRCSPAEERRVRRLTVMLFVLLGVCVLAYFSVSQQEAADRAEVAMAMGSELADSILDLARDGSGQLQTLAWEVSKGVRAGAKEAALAPEDLSRIRDLVHEARAAATLDSRRQALESIGQIVERSARSVH